MIAEGYTTNNSTYPMPKNIKQIPYHPDKIQLFDAVQTEINNLKSRMTFDSTPIDVNTVPHPYWKNIGLPG